MKTTLAYLRCGMRDAGEAIFILASLVLIGFLFGGWPSAGIIAIIFVPWFLVIRHDVGKKRIEQATRRLLGAERRSSRPRRPPPPPNPPPARRCVR